MCCSRKSNNKNLRDFSPFVPEAAVAVNWALHLFVQQLSLKWTKMLLFNRSLDKVDVDGGAVNLKFEVFLCNFSLSASKHPRLKLSIEQSTFALYLCLQLCSLSTVLSVVPVVTLCRDSKNFKDLLKLRCLTFFSSSTTVFPHTFLSAESFKQILSKYAMCNCSQRNVVDGRSCRGNGETLKLIILIKCNLFDISD